MAETPQEINDQPPETTELNPVKSTNRPNVWVFGPGGIKIFCQLGFLLAIERRDWLREAKVLAGVSAGAVLALLLCVGYTVEEIVAESHRFNLFQDVEATSLQEIREKEGIISPKAIRESLEELVRKKLGLVPSLEGLYMATGIELCTVTVAEKLETKEIEVMYVNYREPLFSSISCVEAVIISMNIPYLFHRLEYKGYEFSDGGYGDPYPVNYYDSGDHRILGIYVGVDTRGTSGVIVGLYSRLCFVIDQIYHANVKRASDRCRHILLQTQVLDLTGYTVPLKTKCEMILRGYEEGVRFLSDQEGT